MKSQIPRHNSIGEKIREARKQKGLTLGELAKGICSLGKMSNIENGHIGISDEELTEFSKKLNIPANFFLDPNINEKIKELDYDRQKINDILTLNNWKTAKTLLDQFKEKIDNYQINTREIDYHYLSAVYYVKTNQLQRAETILKGIIIEEQDNSYNIKVKLKSYNALASIYFKQKGLTKSIQILDQALVLSKANPTITKIERDDLYFNQSVLYLYIGENLHSLKSLNKINHHIIHPLETDYLKLLLTFLEDKANTSVREDLLALRERLQQANDQEGIYRGWALTIYTLMSTYPETDTIKKWKAILLNDLDLLREVERLKDTSLALTQLCLTVCLAHSESRSIVNELIQRTKPLLLQVTNPLLIARNYYLEAKLLQQVKPIDEATTLSLFQKALDSFDANYQGLLKADILFEIAKLKQVKNEAMQGLELYHSHLNEQFLFTHFHELILPDFKF